MELEKNMTSLELQENFKIEMLLCLSTEVLKECMDKWEDLYDKYSKEMSEVCGIEEKDIKSKRCQDIIDFYKKVLYGTREFKEKTRPEDQIKNEALAIYQIAYKKASSICW